MTVSPANVLVLPPRRGAEFDADTLVDLVGHFSQYCTRKGEVVCDPLATPATPLAAMATGRRYICYQAKKAKYHAIITAVAEEEESTRRGPLLNDVNHLTSSEWMRFGVSVWSVSKSPEERRITGEGEHPAVMPLELCMRLIRCLLSRTDDGPVLDPFCGAGSTLLAAKKLNKRSIGIDISEDYARLSRERTARELSSARVDIHCADIMNVAKLHGIDRLDRVPNDLNPMKLIGTKGGAPRVDVNHAALAEVLRVFREKAADSGTNRLHGKSLQDIFSAAPYGWSKDAVRYLFAMLLIAGEVEYHVPGGDAPVRTAGPQAIEAVKSTNSFNRVGISPRDSRPPIEAMDRASRRLMDLFGDEVLPLEDHISRAVRKHVPGVLEKIGSLPDRIRLLELKGEERAKQILADSADLLKGDASGAAAVLGGTDCELPDHIRWARDVVDALEGGGETEIQDTRTLLATHTELTNLFPSAAAGLLGNNERETIDDVFASDRFHERLTDLRGVVRSLKDRAKDTYRDEHAAYDADLQAALNVLESDPDWLKISEQDREEITGKLVANVPAEPDEENPLRSLQTLLVRRSMLAGRREELLEEIKRRVPGEGKPDGEGDNGEKRTEETLTASQLVTAAVIETPADLETWLGSLRAKIANLLKQRKRVRIKGDERASIRTHATLWRRW